MYTTGFGAIGQGEDTLETVIPKRLMGLEVIQSVYAGNGYAAAVDSESRVSASDTMDSQ